MNTQDLIAFVCFVILNSLAALGAMTVFSIGGLEPIGAVVMAAVVVIAVNHIGVQATRD